MHFPIVPPVLTVVSGHRLLLTYRVRVQDEPGEAHLDRCAVLDIVAKEFTFAMFKTPNHWRQELAAARIGPVQTPEPGLGIEDPQGRAGQRFAVGQCGVKLVEIANPIQDGYDFRRRLELLPFGVPLESLGQAAVVDFPAAMQKIKILVPVTVMIDAIVHVAAPMRR